MVIFSTVGLLIPWKKPYMSAGINLGLLRIVQHLIFKVHWIVLNALFNRLFSFWEKIARGLVKECVGIYLYN